MANEIANSLLVTNGGRQSLVLSALLRQQLYDPTDLRSAMDFIPFSAPGSATMRGTLDAVPGAATAASSETSGGQSNSAYTTAKFDLTVARYVKQYQVTDLFGVTSEGAPIDFAAVVRKLNEAVGLTMTDLLCAAFPNLATSVGTTLVNLSVDTIFLAQFALNLANVGGQYICVLHPQQINDFITSLRAEPGAMQFVAATPEMIAIHGPMARGMWNGIVFLQSDSVTLVNASADRAGAMFGQGCFAYTMAPVRPLLGQIPAGNVLADAGLALVELARDATNGMSTAILNFYPAIAEVEDLRGVQIVTDA